MNLHDLLPTLIILLLGSVIFVPITKKLGLGSVLGYLFSGVIIGPFGLKVVTSPERIMGVSELGVTLFLFLIGLELDPKKLWAMRGSILGMGGLQVGLSTAVFGFGLYYLGFSPLAAFFLGIALSMSSTAIALQSLREKNQLQWPGGKASFAILFFQDLSVIPLLAFLPLMVSTGENSHRPSVLTTFLGGAAALIGVFLFGRYVLRWIFRWIAKTHMREIFTALALLVVLGVSYLMEFVGLSMSLGAFLSGVILANSEYRHEIETDIEPFKGLLMGLFFVSVGMSMNLRAVYEQPSLIFLSVLGLLAIKGAILFLLGKIYKLPIKDNLLMTIMLAQGGEFAFVLYSLAGGFGIFSQDLVGQLYVITAISMALTPLIVLLNERFVERLLLRPVDRAHDKIEEEKPQPVIIAGFGRFGGIVGRILLSKKIGLTVLDHDPSQIDLVRKFGYKAYYGDATRLDLLEAAGAAKAKLLILAVDDFEAIKKTVEIAKLHFPKLKIMSRCRNRQEYYELREIGVETVVRETFGSSLDMGELALKYLGYEAYEAKSIIHFFREHDEDMLVEAIGWADDKSFVNKSIEARKQFETLMNADRVEYRHESGLHWGES